MVYVNFVWHRSFVWQGSYVLHRSFYGIVILHGIWREISGERVFFLEIGRAHV